MTNLERTIRLRAVEPSDADFMYEIENDEAAWRYSDTVAPISRRILRDYALDYNADPFAARQLRLIISVFKAESWYPAGTIDLYEIDPVNRNAFIGIYILPGFRHAGFAKEALHLIDQYARKVINLRFLAAKIESSNIVSLSLFKKCGFEEAAVIPEWFTCLDGTYRDLVITIKRLSSQG